jgi:hypothetical protein
MFLKERHRTPQNCFVKIVTHIGNHAEAGIIHEVSAAVIAKSLENRRGHQGKRDNRPIIVKMGGHDMPKIDLVIAERELENLDPAVWRGRIEHSIEDRLDEQQAECVQQSNRSHQNHGEQRLQRVRAEVVQQANELTHSPAHLY